LGTLAGLSSSGDICPEGEGRSDSAVTDNQLVRAADRLRFEAGKDPRPVALAQKRDLEHI
jgi:hypothetical protein